MHSASTANINIWLGLLISLALMPAAPVFAQAEKPSVVFILADNVGYGDLGPYGGGELRGAPTPRIDELAREGLRLSQSVDADSCTEGCSCESVYRGDWKPKGSRRT